VAVIPPSDPERGAALACLVQALVDRFQRTGAFADLDSAISTARDAATAIPVDSEYRGAVLTSLSDALQARYQRAEDLADARIDVGSGHHGTVRDNKGSFHSGGAYWVTWGVNWFRS
jgi:hypothetical protein